MEYVFVVDDANNNKKLGAFLRGAGVSASLIRSVKYQADGLLVDGQRAKTNAIVHTGQRVRVAAPMADDNPLSACETDVPIAYESDDVLVYDKPAGMATHPTRNQPDGTLANVYAALMRSRGSADAFRPTNRLDRNTSGLVLAAKTRFAASRLAQSATKRYFAVVEGNLAGAGTIDAPIGRDAQSIIRRCVCTDGQPSVTEYRAVQPLRGHTLVEVRTLTGRTHQIRVHMAHIGHPLAGDDLYGGSTGEIDRHALHCATLWFNDPVSGMQVEVNSPLPADLRALVERLRGDNE